MSLIKCPKCGKEISDKAKECPGCGEIINSTEPNAQQIKCPECGSILAHNFDVCPNCGCPIKDYSANKPQQVEVSGVKIAKSSKKIILGIIILLIVCILGGIGFKVYSNKKAKDNYRKKYNAYIDNLNETRNLMLSGAADSEKLCNLTLEVWNNSIFNEDSSETDKYTKNNNVFYDDFNTALSNLFQDPDTINKVSNIEDNQEEVKKDMKKLQDVPKGLDNCYNSISDMYKEYTTFTNLATSPSGNYKDYSNKFNDTDTELMSYYDKLGSQIPNKMKKK